MPQARERSLRFTWAHFENWRNFTRVEAELRGRAFLVGPNASGKSNFLDAFRFLRDVAAVGGGFAEAVRRRGGVSKLRALAARRDPAIVLAVRLGSDESPNLWTYELTFTQNRLRQPVIKRERVCREGRVLLQRPDKADKADPERLTQTHLEQVYANQEFRELAEVFSEVQYLHVIPQLVREPDRWIVRKNDPYGGDLLEQIARTNERVRQARLRRISEAVGLAVPQLAALELWRDPHTGMPHLRGKYSHWRPRGAWQNEEQFSDGTLRLVGLLWALLDGSGPLLLEEPELSLHPEVVRYIPSMLARLQRKRGRQLLLSTHSFDLLRDEGIAPDEVLVLQPGQEGTALSLARDIGEVQALLEEGATIADAVLPLTRPDEARQLPLLFE